jgi:hypothetical protein
MNMEVLSSSGNPDAPAKPCSMASKSSAMGNGISEYCAMGAEASSSEEDLPLENHSM